MRAEARAKPLRRGKDNNILEPLKFNSTPSFTPTILSRYPLVLSFVEYLLVRYCSVAVVLDKGPNIVVSGYLPFLRAREW